MAKRHGMRMFLQRLHGGSSLPTHLIFILRHASHAPEVSDCHSDDWHGQGIVAEEDRVEQKTRWEGSGGAFHELWGHARDGASTRELVS